MNHKSAAAFWGVVVLWVIAVWVWALTSHHPPSRFASSLIPRSPEWAQFWASVIGLIVAIAVPAWLHIRDRTERHNERLNRARANAIGMRSDLVLLESVFSSVSRPKHPLDGSDRDPSDAIDQIRRALDVAPEKEEMMPLMTELGSATFAVQRLFDNLEQTRAIVAVVASRSTLALASDVEGLRSRVAVLAEQAKLAKLKLDDLFR